MAAGFPPEVLWLSPGLTTTALLLERVKVGVIGPRSFSVDVWVCLELPNAKDTALLPGSVEVGITDEYPTEDVPECSRVATVPETTALISGRVDVGACVAMENLPENVWLPPKSPKVTVLEGTAGMDMNVRVISEGGWLSPGPLELMVLETTILLSEEVEVAAIAMEN